MLPSRLRLKDSAAIKRVLSKGKRFSGRYLRACFLPMDAFKATVVVSSKCSKSAAVRNRIKRRIRGALEELLDCFPSVWVVILPVNQEVEDVDFGILREDLRKLLSYATGDTG